MKERRRLNYILTKRDVLGKAYNKQKGGKKSYLSTNEIDDWGEKE